MKYVLTYKTRGNDTPKGNLDAQRSALKLLSSWQPHAPEGITEWVQRIDGTGGFAVVRTDDAAALYKDLATWSPWLEFEVIPVIELSESTAASEEAIQAAAAALG
jgi:hypothetical protein